MQAFATQKSVTASISNFTNAVPQICHGKSSLYGLVTTHLQSLLNTETNMWDLGTFLRLFIRGYFKTYYIHSSRLILGTKFSVKSLAIDKDPTFGVAYDNIEVTKLLRCNYLNLLKALHSNYPSNI